MVIEKQKERQAIKLVSLFFVPFSGSKPALPEPVRPRNALFWAV
jgi:hypothetical protein